LAIVESSEFIVLASIIPPVATARIAPLRLESIDCSGSSPGARP
jgi:hypothetical protein